MSRVQQIERDVEQLTPQEFNELASWIDTRRQEEWKRQMDHDAASGRLDFLFQEAEAEREAGQLHDWPGDNVIGQKR